MRPIRLQLGTRLRALREEQALRAVDAASLIGVEVAHLYNIERGVAAPSLDLLIAFAMLYRVDVADLFAFPGMNARHDLRELVRLCPNGKLDEARASLAHIAGVEPVPLNTRAGRKAR